MDSILFADEISYLKEAVKEITDAGVNKIVLLSHVGYLRDQEIALTADATCLWVETLILGRAAMGEVVTQLDLTDRRRISRDGRPVFVENLRLTDAVLAQDGPALLAGARALAPPDRLRFSASIRSTTLSLGGGAAATPSSPPSCLLRISARSASS